MENFNFNYNDGGRNKYFKTTKTGDCVTRAISIATGKDYLDVYKDINKLAKKERVGTRKKGISNARNGVYKDTYKKYLISLGWEWIPTMEIGKGCQVHLTPTELPNNDVIIVRVSKHLTTIVNGILNDTYDCSRDGNRCVYGYFRRAR